ncbi:transposase, IS481 family [Bordetella pertussis CHLA-13]|nr:transposase, IS481 family [Bordetella pertussis CHLA-13]
MAGPLPGSGPGGLGRCVLAPDGLAPSDCAGQGAGYRGAAPQAADPSAHRPGAGRVSQPRQPRPGPRRSVAPGRPGAGRAGGEPAEPVVRYEHQAPGDLLHIDIKKLGRIQRPGHRVTGNRRDTVEGAGWDFVFVAIDDHARVAFTDIHPDERFPSAVQFLKDAVAYYQRLGVTIQRLLTDNGSAFRSRAFAALCHELGIKHRFTRPYRPQTNGKAERFIQSALREWAYAHTYQNSQHRADAMKSWLHHYNWHRPHQGIGRAVPISRLNLDEYNLLTVHS